MLINPFVLKKPTKLITTRMNRTLYKRLTKKKLCRKNRHSRWCKPNRNTQR